MTRYALIVFAIIVTGCSCEKRIARLIDKCPIDPVIDYNTVIAYRDTVIEVFVPGETEYIEVPVPVTENCPELPQIKPVTVETEFARAEASLISDRLKLSLIQKNKLFQFKLDSAIKTNTDTITITSYIKQEVPVKPKYCDFFMYGFWVSLGILLLLAAIVILILKK